MDRIRLNASEWMDFRSGEKKCFLLTNGLGGYCSLTVMGNAARNDQALLMGALKAPTVREHLISNVWETLEVDGEETELFSQEFVNRTQNVEGFRFLEGFEMGSLPVWFYRVPLLHRHKIIVLLSALHEQILAVDEVVGGHSLVEGSKLLLVERHATALNELAHLTL